MCKRGSIEEDIKILGIDPYKWNEFVKMNSWKETRMTQYKERELPNVREMPTERELPPARVVQGEFESITVPIDEREAFIRHKQELERRWFGYYKKCKDQQKKFKLIDQYNCLARQR